jgi:transcriptional regulator with XRE-family HTH domain
MINGKEIREKRKALGWSAQQLADILKVSKDNVYKWEKGHVPQNPEDYAKVETWLNGKLENVPKVTQQINEPAVQYESDPRRFSLERSLENLTQDKLKSTAIIERLVALLEKQFDQAGVELPPKDAKFTEDVRTVNKVKEGK